MKFSCKNSDCGNEPTLRVLRSEIDGMVNDYNDDQVLICRPCAELWRVGDGSVEFEMIEPEIPKCDFCNRQGSAVLSYVTTAFGTQDQLGLFHNLGGGWACCPDCSPYVEIGDAITLAKHHCQMTEVVGDKRRRMMPELTRLYTDFYEHLVGGPFEGMDGDACEAWLIERGYGPGRGR